MTNLTQADYLARQPDIRPGMAKLAELEAENARLREALIEIANRASNMMDADAAEWMPSIYQIACEAVGEDPSRLLRSHQQRTDKP